MVAFFKALNPVQMQIKQFPYNIKRPILAIHLYFNSLDDDISVGILSYPG